MQKILNCQCVNEYQDQRYGPARRLHNSTGGKGVKAFRCTVCGKEKLPASKAVVPVAKAKSKAA